MLPDSDDFPPNMLEARGLAVVTLVVLLEFGEPVGGVGFWISGMGRTPVQGTPVDENGHSRSGKHDVDRDALDSAVKTKPSPPCMQG